MLPRKRQKLEPNILSSQPGRAGHHDSIGQAGLPYSHLAASQASKLEPSESLETDELTEMALLQRRNRYLHELCEAYQAQLSDDLQQQSSTDQDCTEASMLGIAQSAANAPRIMHSNLPHLSRLEQLSAAASIRELDARRAIAVLYGKHLRYFVKSTTIDLGRSTNTLGKVDIDLTEEGDARKVSRQQAQLALHSDGHFLITNIGRRTICVNGVQVMQHHSIKLNHLSLLDLAGIHLLFIVNHLAVHRMIARSQNLVL